MATSWRNIFMFSSSPIFTNGKNLVYLFMRLPSWSATHLWNVEILPISLLQKKEDFCVWWLNYVSDNFHPDCRIHKRFCKVIKIGWKFNWIQRIWCTFDFIQVFFFEESKVFQTNFQHNLHEKKVYQYSSFSWTFI